MANAAAGIAGAAVTGEGGGLAVPSGLETPLGPAAAPALSRTELVHLFAERTADYGAGVHRTGPDQVADCVARICAGRGIARLIAPPDLDPAWLPESIEIVADSPALSPQALDEVGAVLTASRLAVAFTGTIAFDGGAGQGRRAATLVPDLHICVIDGASIVYALDEAMAVLAPASAEGRPITFTSGPSATSDIELTRVEGVHGPRTLEVIITT